MKRELIVATYVIFDSRILLLLHKKLAKWLPPGGHVEEGETSDEAALREVMEETGFNVELLPQENLWMQQWNAKSLPRPYLRLLAQIPPYKEEPPHEHIIDIFIAKLTHSHSEPAGCEECRWFTLEELNQLKPDEEIFVETLETAKHLFDQPHLFV